MWKESATRSSSARKVKERDKVVHLERGGRALQGDPEAARPKAAAAAAARGGGARGADERATSSARSATFVERQPGDAPRRSRRRSCSSCRARERVDVDLKNAAGRRHEGAVGKAALHARDQRRDFMAMATGQADAMKLFSTGKLKISGDVMASQKLGFLKKITPEMVLAETKKRARRRAAGGAAAAAASGGLHADASTTRSRSSQEYLKQNPDARRRRSASIYLLEDRQHSAWTARPQERRRQRHAGRRRGRVHARALRRGLPRDDAGQGRPDEAVHDRQAQDQRQRDGVAEAEVPARRSIPSKAIEVVAKRRGAAVARRRRLRQAGSAARRRRPTRTRRSSSRRSSKRLAENAGLASEVRANVTFDVTRARARRQTFDARR